MAAGLGAWHEPRVTQLDLTQVTRWTQVRTATWVLLAFVVAGDLVGVFACFMYDVLPSRHESSLLYYTVWLVLGVFVGLVAYMQAGNAIANVETRWYDLPGAKAVSHTILAVFAAILSALTAISWAFLWSWHDEGLFVPDDAAATVIFFGTILATAAFGHHLFLVPPNRRADGRSARLRGHAGTTNAHGQLEARLRRPTRVGAASPRRNGRDVRIRARSGDVGRRCGRPVRHLRPADDARLSDGGVAAVLVDLEPARGVGRFGREALRRRRPGARRRGEAAAGVGSIHGQHALLGG
jgi:hypothetical protein